MRNFKLFILILFLVGLSVNVAAAKKVIIPKDHHKPIIIEIGKKNLKYYQLFQKKNTTINVEGPGELHIYTRGIIPSGDISSNDYEIYYSVDGAKRKTKLFKNIKVSSNAKFKTKKTILPAQIKKLVLKLKRGRHTIIIHKNNSKTKVLARFLFKEKKLKKEKWISYSPNPPYDPVNIVVNEEIVKYFRFSAKKPLKVSIIGPTKVRIFTRTENHYDSRGRVIYRVQVKCDNKIQNTYQISSVRSQTALYKNDKSLVPGKGREFLITVPKGKHLYEIYPIDQHRNSLLGRILFPKKDAKLKD